MELKSYLRISPLHPKHLQFMYSEAPPYYLAELSFGILAPIDLR
jgi:hypothetical protein